MLKMVVFDMDGLLLDSEIVYKRGWIAVAKKKGLSLSLADMNGWAGQGRTQTHEKMVALFGSNELVDELHRDREKYIAEQVENGGLQLKPYAKKALRTAKSKGLLVGLATSTFKKRASAYIEHFGLSEYFDFVTFGDEVERTKPDPEIYQTSLLKANIKAPEALAVEDSLLGATAATQAGLKVVLIPDQSLEENYSEAEKANLALLIEGTSLKILVDYLEQEC